MYLDNTLMVAPSFFILPFIVALIGLPIVPKHKRSAFYVVSLFIQFLAGIMLATEQAGTLDGPFGWFKRMLITGKFGYAFSREGAWIVERLGIYLLVVLVLAIAFDVIYSPKSGDSAQPQEKTNGNDTSKHFVKYKVKRTMEAEYFIVTIEELKSGVASGKINQEWWVKREDQGDCDLVRVREVYAHE